MERGILINPYDETITEVRDKFVEDYQNIHKNLTELGVHSVHTLTCVRLSNYGDVIWLDDEGHLTAGRKCWSLTGYSYPLAGRGLILGTDHQGETTSCSGFITPAFVHKLVTWLRLLTTAEFGPSRESTVDHPIFGRVVQITQGAPRVRYEEET